MDISYLGGSTFLLRGRDASLITDPAVDRGSKSNANVATVSAASAEAPSIEGPSRVIYRPGEYEVSGVLVKAVQTHRNAEEGTRTLAYTITLDNVVLCHLGRLDRVLTSAEAGELGNVEVLFLPVGGPDTLSSSAASQTVALLSPKLVIPMLYETTGATAAPAEQTEDGEESASGAVVIPSLEPFLKEMGVQEIAPQNRLSVTPTNQPATMQVVLLQPRK